MPEAVLSGINIFPIKSLAGLSQSASFVSHEGLSFDRRFMLATPEGELLSAREVPELLLFCTLLREQGLEVLSPKGKRIRIPYPDPQQSYSQVKVWGRSISAQRSHEIIDKWFSAQLGRPCQLLFFAEQSKSSSLDEPNIAVAFADEYPLLLLSEASLNDLNSRSLAPVTMAHFRGNLIIKGAKAFAEDSWKKIRIGDVIFEVKKPCSRCIMTTYDPKSAQSIPDNEPVKTLSQYRLGEDQEIYFGQNLVALNEGVVQRGDKIEILETQAPARYPNNAKINHFKIKAEAQNQLWGAEQRIELTCISRVEETPNVATFRFQLEHGYTANYIAGQFITLFPQIKGQEFSRCYTLSSSPSRNTDIAITVKQVAKGKVSNWLHEQLQVGDKITATGPSGAFHAKATERPKLLLLSAGSGITPMLSMARYLCDTHSDKDIVFYHQARTESDLICEDELRWLKRQNSNIKLVFGLTQPTSAWSEVRGAIGLEQFKQHIPDLKERAVLCCGPEGFMQQTKSLCQKLGSDKRNWFEESFNSNSSPATLDLDIVKLNVAINRNNFVGDNQNPILAQAEINGDSIPFGCRAGVCGVCKVKLLEGKVQTFSDVPLSEEEKNQGIILACSCIPKTDISIQK